MVDDHDVRAAATGPTTSRSVEQEVDGPGRGSGRSRARSGSTRRGTGCRGSAARRARGCRRCPGRSRRVTPSGSARAGTRPTDEGVVEADPLASGRRAATGDWVPWKTMSLKSSGIPSRWHSAWWPRQTARNGCSALEQRVDRRPERGDLRVVAVARVARAGSDDDEVVAVEAARAGSPRAGPPRWSCPSPPSTWRSMFTKSSSPSRITTLLPGQPRVGRRARPGRSARTCSAAGCGR